MASKATLETAIRNDILATIKVAMDAHTDADGLAVSASDMVWPVVDAEGNEKFVKVSVTIPRGTRNGSGSYDPYDGYAAAEMWKEESETRAAKKAVAAANKAKREGKVAKPKQEEAE